MVTAIGLRNVSKVFDGGTSAAVDDLSLEINPGEFLVLLGPSGCGKSTVLRMIAGLERPTGGQILLDGKSVNHLTPQQRGAAMVFQSFALYPHMRVIDNIAFPLQLTGMDPGESRTRAVEMATALGIGDLLKRRPNQLSGGQRQRVAMGRALIRRPRLFLMDEPLSNLDMGMRAELRGEISQLVAERRITTIYVTHDQTEALTMADRVAVMTKGRLQDLGTAREVYERPATAYVAAFLGSPRINLLEADVDVRLDSHISLYLGKQDIKLAWGTLQSRAIARYHGERITVGIRSESLTLAPYGHPGTSIWGRVQSVEHHGHESLVYVGIGARAVVPDGLQDSARVEEVQDTRRSRLAKWLDRKFDPPPPPKQEDSTGPLSTGRHLRRLGELVVRLPPHQAPPVGAAVGIRVHMNTVHFFDSEGNRIDPHLS